MPKRIRMAPAVLFRGDQGRIATDKAGCFQFFASKGSCGYDEGELNLLSGGGEMAVSRIGPGTRIGFIGTGVMGVSMAGRLIEAGYVLTVYNRTPEKAAPLLEKGARLAETVARASAGQDVVITMVGFPREVEQVYLGEGGILESADKGTIVVDMTTSSPGLARKISEAGHTRGLFVLDAPVSGGDIGARDGKLSIMVGGDEEAFQAMQEAFEVLGSRIVYQGPAGAGQHTKMANQIAIASNMIGVCEALAYARKAGLDHNKVMESISGGAAGSWSLSHLGPRMLAGNFDPGFYVKHFIKDMGIADEEACQMELDTPGLKLALSLYRKLEEMGFGDDGTQALYRLFEDHQT